MIAFFELGVQGLNGTAEQRTLKLDDTLIEGDPAVHGRKEAERSLTPNICALDCRSVFQHGQERKDATLRKIGVFEKSTCFANYSSEF
jgi:hypothetical protein